MTRFTSILTGLVLAAAVGANGAMAATATTAKVAKPRSPESIECSKQADAKGLHGKDRKAFRSTCLAQAKAAKSATAKKPATAPAADKKS